MIIWYFQNFKKPKISSRKIFPKFRNKDQTDFSKNALQMVNQTYPVFYRTVVRTVAYRTIDRYVRYELGRYEKSKREIDFSESYSFFRQNVRYGLVRYDSTVRYVSIYTVRLVWCDLVYFLMLLHVSLVGTRGRDVPLREIANSTSLVRRD